MMRITMNTITSLVSRASAVLVTVVALQGCETINAQSDYDKGFSFAGYDTFAWISEHPLVASEAGVSPLAEQRIQRAFTDVMQSKGIRYVADAAQADFVVAFSLGSREKVSVTSTPMYGGYYRMGGGYWGAPYYQDVDVRQYTQGRLAIDVFDVKERRPVWHGFATKNLTESVRADPEPVIREAVTTILKDFPPTP
jgi:hypothetical protein